MLDFSWASDHPNLYKTCRLFQLSEIANPVKFKYKSLPGIIQEGPQCGPVALAMLTEQNTVDAIMKEALCCGYSYNGEIFSVKDMQSLCNVFLPAPSELFDGDLNCNFVVQFLLEGGCMLVPYDSDKNHAPCMQRGHKAHWCAVSGIIETENDVYVLAMHGKSKNVAVWSLCDLAKSNSQLMEFSPDRKYSNLKYKLPEGSIAGPLGLCNKAVLIKFS